MSSTSFILPKTTSNNQQLFEASLQTLKKTDEKLAKSLKLPEILCEEKGKKLQGSTEVLTPDHALFSKINRRIATIQERLKKNDEKIKDPLEQILLIYDGYIMKSCQPTSEEMQTDWDFYQKQYPNGPQTKDSPPKGGALGAYYSKKYREARIEGTALEQVYFLERMASLITEEEVSWKAAAPLNAALAIAEKENFSNKHKRRLQKRIEHLENRTLEPMEIHIGDLHKGKLREDRKKLKAIRKRIDENLKTLPFPKVLARAAQDYQQFFRTIALESIEVLGKPPTAYALVGFGEMARQEMLPFSELQFAILLERADETTLPYFQELCKLIELRVTNLGETPFRASQIDRIKAYQIDHLRALQVDRSPTPEGFCLSRSGATPLKNKKLLGTPKQVAQLESFDRLEKKDLLSELFGDLTLVAGEEKLLEAYGEIYQSNVKAKGKPKFEEYLSNLLIQSYIRDLTPQIERDEQEVLQPFNLHAKLIAPFQRAFMALKMHFQLQTANPFEIVDELVTKNVLRPQGAEFLKSAYETALTLSLKAQAFYQGREDLISYPSEENDRLLSMSDEMIDQLREVYKTATAFQKALVNFVGGKPKALFLESFYSEDFITLGEIERELRLFKEADAYFEKAFKMNPNLASVNGLMSGVYRRKGEDKRRRSEVKSVFEVREIQKAKLAEQIKDDSSSSVEDLDEFVTALNCAQQALNLASSPLERAAALKNIGLAHFSSEDFAHARTSFDEALKIYEELDPNDHQNLAALLNRIAFTYRHEGNFQKALHFHERAFNMLENLHGKNMDVDLSNSLQYMGYACYELKEYEKAVDYFVQALAFLNNTDPAAYQENIRVILNNIGHAYKAKKDYVQVIKWYGFAVEQYEKYYQTPHVELSEVYNRLGEVYFLNGDGSQALVYFQKAVDNYKELNREGNQSKIAMALNQVAKAHRLTGKKEDAISVHNQALVILRSHYGSAANKDICFVQASLGSTYLKFDLLEDAVQTWQSAEEGYEQLSHPKLKSSQLKVLHCLQKAYTSLGNQEKIQEYQEKIRNLEASQ